MMKAHHFQLPGLICVGLVLFLAVFISVLAWVFRRGSVQFYKSLELYPLQDLNPIRKGEQ